jgi:virginiamycin B lyase
MTKLTRRAAVLNAAAAAAYVPALAQTSSHAAVKPPRFVAHAIPTANAKPYLITPGPDNAIWFCESGAGKIGRLDLGSGAISEFVIPTPDNQTTGIAAGADGNLWFSENATAKIGRITPKGAIAEFACPTANATPNGITLGPDGRIWFIEANVGKLAAIAPDGRFEEMVLNGLSPGTKPLSLAFRGPTPWFSEPEIDKIGSLSGGKVSELALKSGSQPRAMFAHPNGDIWFAATSNAFLGRIDSQNRVNVYALSDAKAEPRSLAVTPDGNIWFTEDAVQKMGCMAPDGTLLGEFAIPAPLRGPRGMCVHRDGRIFFSAYESGHIGELAFS